MTVQNTLTEPGEPFVRTLLSWYRKNKRDLPWRDTGIPEDVWISEIMLQQTRVEAVKGYFTRFRAALPDIPSIAACPEDRLLRLWEGLGYYSRARNLKKCANVLVQDYGGRLPADYTALLQLPGIGPYTAGAIASIAFGIPVPAVDGNVLRVWARLTDCPEDVGLDPTKKKFEAEIGSLIRSSYASPAEFPAPEDSRTEFSVSDFNQALMELGAVVCLPNGTPMCPGCPVRSFCRASCHALTTASSRGSFGISENVSHAAAQGASENPETTSEFSDEYYRYVLRLPVKGPKKARRVEKRTVLVIRDGDRFLVQKRPGKGLLAGLYEFPGFSGFLSQEDAAEAAASLGFTPLKVTPLPEGKHVFTHIEWHMKAWEVRVASFSMGEGTVSPESSSWLPGSVPEAAAAMKGRRQQQPDRDMPASPETKEALLLTGEELRSFAIPSAFRTWVSWYALRRASDS